VRLERVTRKKKLPRYLELLAIVSFILLTAFLAFGSFGDHLSW
jgi:hypothetical protein